MKQTTYSTDLTEPDFLLLKSCLNIRRRSKWSLVHILNAIFYLCNEGNKWRSLPRDFEVPWPTVYWYFRKWLRDGSWVAMNELLVMNRRLAMGLEALPGSIVVDGQTVKNSATATDKVGVDGGKKIKGRMRILVSDSQGNLLYTKCFPANSHDGVAARNWWHDELRKLPTLENVKTIQADHHYAGRFKDYFDAHTSIQVRISKTLVDRPAQTKMAIHKGRWVVERTIAWITNSRRLARDYERLQQCTEAFCIISSISRILRNPICLN